MTKEEFLSRALSDISERRVAKKKQELREYEAFKLDAIIHSARRYPRGYKRRVPGQT